MTQDLRWATTTFIDPAEAAVTRETFCPACRETVLAGNVGSAERLSYALVGDAVNLASRIG